MNEELVVKPRNDFVFKTLFVKHTELLVDFLSYALDMPPEEIADITITNPELLPGTYDEKFARLDLILTQPDGTKINVEVQNRDEGDYKERSVFNCSKMYTKDVNAGDEYKEIPRTICINIVQFPLFKDSGCICTVFPTIQETGEIVTDKWEIIYFQTTKLPKDKQGGLWDWIKLFTITTKGELESMENVQTIGVKKAAGFIRKMNADDRMREIARVQERARMTEYSALKKSREEGIQAGLKRGIKKGRQEGRQEGIIIVAKNFLKNGLTDEQVAAGTDLSLEEIRELRTQL
ncbi:MAG: Rpn family recombination-promoting nuclease/putative transposase [Ruminococcus sp.]|jgi:predicted transposase/invertase (TIGR01784 family)|nr:Rpn family recombination-promoting nuclease/putative transposase [Ruminococcus sp.]